MVDTRFDAPTVDMIKDLQDGVIDVGILWGPIAGNFAKDAKPALQVTPLVNETTGPKWSIAWALACAIPTRSGNVR